MIPLTSAKSELIAHHLRINETPGVITDCAPLSIIAHFHTTLLSAGSDQSYIILGAAYI